MSVPTSAPRQPLVGLALSFVVGTALGLRFEGTAPALSIGVAAAAAWAFAQRAARRVRTANTLAVAAVHVLVAATAALSASLASRHRAHELSALREIMEAGEDVTVLGTVVTEPTGTRLPHGGACLAFDVRVRAIPDDFGGERPEPFVLPVAWYGSVAMLGSNPSRPMPRAGEGWKLTGRLRDASPRRGAPRFVLNVRGTGNDRWPPADSRPWVAAGWELRRSAAESLSRGIEQAPHVVAILRAMVLGFRSEIPPDMRTIFANSGTIHIFAISGLHVGILAGLLAAVLPLTRVPKPQWGWLLGPVLVLYTLLSGASPSAVRACVMSLLYFGGPLFRRKPNALSALAAAAVTILACAPLQIASLAFLFSFACVVALLVLSPIFLRLWTPDADGVDAALPTDLAALIQDASIASGSAAPPGPRVPAWPVRCLRWTTSVVRKSLAVSVAAWLASTPITAICFGRISPVAVVGNLFAIPLATGIVLCGSLSLVGGLVAEWFSTTFNCAAVALTACLVALTESTLRLPGATFEVQPWPVWSAVPWYAGCVVAALLLRLRLRRREQAAAAEDAAPSQGRREASRIRNAEPSTAGSGSRR